MPVHREKERRTIRREASNAERPIITQDKPLRSSRNVKRIDSEGDRSAITQEKPKAKDPGKSVKPSGDARSNAKSVIYLKDVLEKRKVEKKLKDDSSRKAQEVNKRELRKEPTPRYRTKTRTLSPTEVKQLIPTVMAEKKEEVAAETPAVEGQVEEPEVPSEDEESEEDYEDDFEDYESDFEEDDEEETKEAVVVQSPMKAPKSSSEMRELEEIRKALKLENDLTARSSGTPSPELSMEKKPVRFRSKTEEEAAKKARTRGRELLSMITLDAVSYTFLDIPAIPYEVYMKIYGRSNAKQVYVQTNEDNLNEETQTDEVEVRNKWVQKPPEMSQRYRPTREERLGVGGDDSPQQEPTMTVVDTNKLSSFLNTASQMILTILELKTGNYLGVDALPYKAEELFFSEGFVPLNVSDLPFLNGKSVSDICCLRNLPNLMLSVHTDQAKKFSDSIVCVWSIHELSKPMKVLTASNRITAVRFGPQQENLIFAGLSDGSVCLWDLRESSALHQSTLDRDTGWVLRSPTYSTAQISNGHTDQVMSLQILKEGDEYHGRDFAPIQICSLDESGTVIIWSVVQGRNMKNITSEEDTGLAPWGKVKLVKSSSFSVAAMSGNHPTALYITCNDLALHHSGELEMYVTNSLGVVNHVSKYGTAMKPKLYRTADQVVETTCLEMCPFNSDYFLAGCKDGSIRLYCRNQELPLISLSGIVTEEGPQASIVSLAWLFLRPFVIFALDSLSRLHIWDLGISDMYPEVTLTLSKKKVSCVRLMQSENPKERPHLVIATKDGKIEIHRLKEKFSSRSSSEIHKDMKKFLKYVSIL